MTSAQQSWLPPSPSTWPLRVKLVAAVVLLVGVGLAIASGSAVAALRTYMYGKVDNELQSTAQSVARSLRQPDLFQEEERPLLPTQYVLGRVTFDGQLAEYQKAKLSTTPGLPDLPAIDGDQAQELAGEPFTVPSTEGQHHWRVIILPYQSGSGFVVVGASLATTEATVGQLTAIVLVVGAGVLVLVGALGYVIVRTSLRPLVEVESTAAAIAAGDLSRRVPRQDPHTEIGRLSTAFNSMLGQIEQAFHDRQDSEAAARLSEHKMRQFVADASHELRTPLTSIRGFSELYRQGAVQSPDDIARLMRRIEDESTRMGLLVDDLLLLARLDQERPMEREPVDLVQLAQDAVGDAAAVQPDRDISLEADQQNRPVVVGDEARLRQVLGNLVGNALTHTPIDAPIVVRVGPEPGDARHARLEVVDSGPGLSPEDAGQVFERFYRVDPSRSRAAGGTGLGLSIVAAIVAGHGGRVRVETTPDEGATFRVRLPRADQET